MILNKCRLQPVLGGLGVPAAPWSHHCNLDPVTLLLSFANFLAGFSRKSMGKFAGKAASHWDKSFLPAHLHPGLLCLNCASTQAHLLRITQCLSRTLPDLCLIVLLGIPVYSLQLAYYLSQLPYALMHACSTSCAPPCILTPLPCAMPLAYPGR